MMRSRILLIVVLLTGIAACASYFSDESVVVELIERVPGASRFQISSAAGGNIRFVQFTLGNAAAKTFGYPPDLTRIAEFARSQLIQRGYCAKGFTIVDNKVVYTGTYGTQFKFERS
jgi:hypothetical protein